MAFDAMTAAQAYAQTVQRAKDGVPEAAVAGEAGGFAQMVEQAALQARDALAQAEQTSQQAAVGQAGLVEVVTAVTAAEATLETVVAVRDQVVRAYQDIIRMPI